ADSIVGSPATDREVQKMPSVEVRRSPFCPTATHIRPLQATPKKLPVPREVQAMPSGEVRIPPGPTATHSEPFHTTWYRVPTPEARVTQTLPAAEVQIPLPPTATHIEPFQAMPYMEAPVPISAPLHTFRAPETV